MITYAVEFEGLGFYAADQRGKYEWQFTSDLNKAHEYKSITGANGRGVIGIELAAQEYTYVDPTDLLKKAGSSLRYRVVKITRASIVTETGDWTDINCTE